MKIKKAKIDTTEFDYVKVGTAYYRHIEKIDASGRNKKKLVAWTRQDIMDNFGKKFLREIPQYTSFCNIPSHTDYKHMHGDSYNLYYPIEHKIKKGEWPWIEKLIRHIFQDQYELGLDYIQLLYLRPLEKLPILCLVSKENATGKTTFLNFLHMIFQDNVAVLGNQDLVSSFNAHYATKLLIAVDESKIDKTITLEKVKSLATAKTIFYSEKFRSPEEVDFFGKIIMMSNHEDNFITAKQEDIRYWVRKVPLPTEVNYDIEDDIRKELPAFLYDLQRRELSTQKKSRMWFEPKAIETDALNNIKEHSRSWLTKEIEEYITNYFIENIEKEYIYARAIEIKEKWFYHKNNVEISYIQRLLKDEIKCDSIKKVVRYENLLGNQVVGRVFKFYRSDYIDVDEYENVTDDEQLKIKADANPF